MVVPFFGPKSPDWRVSDWLEVSEGIRFSFEQRLYDLVNLLPFSTEIVDLEICGSYAFGCANLASDLDICIVLNSAEAQGLARNWWFSKKDGNEAFYEFVNRHHGLELQYGIKIDLCPAAHDQKTYNIVYSLKDKRYYGKSPEDRIETRRKWNQETLRFEECPRIPRTLSYEKDPWL